MNWAWPHAFWLLLLLPPLLWWRTRRRTRPSLRFSHGPALEGLPVTWRLRLRWLPTALLTVGLLAAVIALARPRRALERTLLHTEGVDIVLVVDVSTSMLAEDLDPGGGTLNRIDAARAVLRAFVANRPHDRLALIAFSAYPYTLAPLTLDHTWLTQRLDALQTGMIEDGTAIGDGLASAVNRLRDSPAASRVVILATDGQNNRGQLDPDQAAALAKSLEVRVYTVGIGASGFVRYPVTDPFGRRRYTRIESDVDDAGLTRVAQATGGRYFRVRTAREFEGVYAEIDRLEKTEIELEHFTRFEERFGPWLALALGALALEPFLRLSRLGRLP